MIYRNNFVAIQAILWGIIPISYWVFGHPYFLYTLIIFSNVVLLYFIDRLIIPFNMLIVNLIILFFLALSMINEFGKFPEFDLYVAIIVFAIKLSFLIIFIPHEKTLHFFNVFFFVSTVMAIIHLFSIFNGLIEEHFGRYKFLGNSHPNLGGEIYAIASFAGAVSCKRKKMLFFSMIMFASAYFMQARTGMLVIFITAVLKLAIGENGKINFRSFIISLFGLIITIISFISSSNLRQLILDKILLSNDKYRGASTGFITGRDSQWSKALDDFAQSPFFGHGISWYADGGASAHNAILYSLVYFGIFGLLFWIFIAYNILSILRNNINIFLLISPSLILIIMNDRFLNSNPFPLFIYFSILRFSIKSNFNNQLKNGFFSK